MKKETDERDAVSKDLQREGKRRGGMGWGVSTGRAVLGKTGEAFKIFNTHHERRESLRGAQKTRGAPTIRSDP